MRHRLCDIVCALIFLPNTKNKTSNKYWVQGTLYQLQMICSKTVDSDRIIDTEVCTRQQDLLVRVGHTIVSALGTNAIDHIYGPLNYVRHYAAENYIIWISDLMTPFAWLKFTIIPNEQTK